MTTEDSPRRGDSDRSGGHGTGFGPLTDVRPPAAHRGHLQIDRLSAERSGQIVLREVSFEAPPGSAVVIHGPPDDTSDNRADHRDPDDDGDGTELTTLLGVLVGLHPLRSGAIVLDGVSLADLALAEVRRRIAVVLAEPWLFEGTVGDNICFGRPEVTVDRMQAAARTAGLVGSGSHSGTDGGLDQPVAPDGANLTPVDRRRVALARALASDPAVLVLEEPLAGLDGDDRTALADALDRASWERTTVITGHSPGVVERADIVLRLDGGQLVSASPRSAAIGASVATDGSTPVGNGALTEHGGPAGTDHPDGSIAPDWWADDGRAEIAVPAVSGSPAADRERRRAGRRDRSRSASPHVGSEIAPGYRAAGLIDRGPYTETWLAWSRRLADAVTVRVPRRRPVTYTALEEISREFTIACGVGHPGLASALDADLETELPYVVHERVAGRTLASAIANDGPLAAGEMLTVAYDLAHALEHLHRRGYAHLDLRPENVVRSGPRGAVITDLRHALPLGDQRVRFIERHRRGLVARELTRGAPATPAMDVHALGMVLHQAATGSLVERNDPETGRPLAVDHRGDRRRRPVRELAPATDPEVIRLVEWLAADAPEDRPTMAQVLNELRPLLLRALPTLARAA